MQLQTDAETSPRDSWGALMAGIRSFWPQSAAKMLGKRGIHSSVKLKLVAANSLHEGWLRSMYQLYKESHKVDYERFCEKSQSKFRELALLFDGEEKVVGFLGANWEFVWLKNGKKVLALYMGQAMLAKDLRRSGWSLVPPIVLGLRALARSRGCQVVLWQDALTVRTFMLVAKNAHVYYPHPSEAMPPMYSELREYLGLKNYPELYDVGLGIVRKTERLVTEEEIDPRRLNNPHIRFFAESNPGYINGEGLLQLTPIDSKVLFKSGLRALRRGLRKSKG